MKPLTARPTDIQTAAPRMSRAWKLLRSMIDRPQAVAEPADRPDCLVAQFLAQPADIDLDRVGLPRLVESVDVVQQFGLRNDLVRMVHHISQNAQLLRGQFDRLAAARDDAGRSVER